MLRVTGVNQRMRPLSNVNIDAALDHRDNEELGNGDEQDDHPEARFSIEHVTGTVNLCDYGRGDTRSLGLDSLRLCQSGHAGDLGPALKGLGPGGSILIGRDVVAAERKEVVDLVVGGEETLRLTG
jgi:hypothetical protein